MRLVHQHALTRSLSSRRGHRRYTTVVGAMFDLQATDGNARAGTLVTSHGTLQTPGCLLYTKKGSMLNLTPDMVAKLGPAATALQVDPLHLYAPMPPVYHSPTVFLNSVANPDPATLHAHGKGVRGFAAIGQQMVIAVMRDPFAWPFVAKHNNDGYTSVLLPTGGVKISPELHMDVIQAIQPDIFVAIADDITADSSRNRTHRSVTRTMTWLQHSAALHKQHNVQAEMWAPVMGGADAALRAHSASRCVQEGPPVGGYWVCGMGTGETPAVRQACLDAALAPLPASKPRGVSGLGTPEEVLSAVASGVDVMEGSYPLAATQAGWALSFQVDPPTEGAVPAVDASVNAVVNLWSREFAEDGRPLVEGCGCFACSGYTRAYVHHLLETHEMLAGVLLELHNTHHWLRFMTAMRAAIVGGRFELYKKAMLGQ